MSGKTWVRAKRDRRPAIPPEGWRNWKGGFVRSMTHPDWQRAKNIKKSFGLTLEEWNTILSNQNNSCAICNSPEAGGKHSSWHTDHDHKTGKVRGLLCHGCNVGLGCFSDSIDKLESAIIYLKRSN